MGVAPDEAERQRERDLGVSVLLFGECLGDRGGRFVQLQAAEDQQVGGPASNAGVVVAQERDYFAGALAEGRVHLLSRPTPVDLLRFGCREVETRHEVGRWVEGDELGGEGEEAVALGDIVAEGEIQHRLHRRRSGAQPLAVLEQALGEPAERAIARARGRAVGIAQGARERVERIRHPARVALVRLELGPVGGVLRHVSLCRGGRLRRACGYDLPRVENGVAAQLARVCLRDRTSRAWKKRYR